MQANRPEVILKFASSFDGCFDDLSDKRVVFSGPEDRAEVEALRASCDAILIGAETLRRDNPRLLAEGKGGPLKKVCLTRSGNVEPSSAFFCSGNGEKLLYTTESRRASLEERLKGLATVVAAGAEDISLAMCLEDLFQRGVRRLLLEGGPNLIRQFLEAGFVDSFRLAISSRLISEAQAPRLLAKPRDAFHLESVTELSEMIILRGRRISPE